jgi:predicted nucleic acid-binding protein
MDIVCLTEELAIRAGEIAYEGKVTVYDALPVVIAENKKTVCITADVETQYKKLQPKGYAIELL